MAETVGTVEVVAEVVAEDEAISKICRFALLGVVATSGAISVVAVVVIVDLVIAVVEISGGVVEVAAVVVLRALESSSKSCSYYKIFTSIYLYNSWVITLTS